MKNTTMFEQNKKYSLCPFRKTTRLINGKVYIITSHFIGEKDVDKVMSRLALSRALRETLNK